MSKILYIHGFASSGQSTKSADLFQMLEQEVISPDLIHQPLTDIATLEKILMDEPIQLVVGSSLGGFYALYLMLKHHKNTVLINPSLAPQSTLTDKIGHVKSFKQGADFNWSMQQIDELQQIADVIANNIQQKNLDLSHLLVLLAKHDERLNYQDALDLFKGAKIIVDEQQDHRFSDLRRYQQQLQALYLK